jgi:diguanylate cyclase (GGDEF)-like protein
VVPHFFSLHFTLLRLNHFGRSALDFSQALVIVSVLGIVLGLVIAQTLRSSFAGILSVAALMILGGWLYEAFYDLLTGLPNRALFLKRVKYTVARAKYQPDCQFAIFLLDLDRFRLLNENLGQRVGNRLLLALSDRLYRLTSTHTLARVEGNAFAILWNNLQGKEQALQIANQLQSALMVPFYIDEQELYITVSIGIVLDGASYVWADDLLKDAQIAVYHAKDLGRARYAIFKPSLRVQAVPLLQLETDLQQAVERQELRLHYQAFVSLQTGKIAGFEALVRWQHPQHGLLSPTAFIPIAEDNGRIAAVGRWTLYEACCQLRLWQQLFPSDPPLLISVNLSARQLAQPDLIAQIQEVLQETGLDARSLKLEITESFELEDTEAAIVTLNQMKAIGVRIGIDDFGTGYSSLSYLHRFPADTLKIDQSFISPIGKDGGNETIVHTIITLAHNLGMNVIAEGVETDAQLAMLRRLNCEYGQGYFFSKPLEKAAVEAMLSTAPQW